MNAHWRLLLAVNEGAASTVPGNGQVSAGTPDSSSAYDPSMVGARGRTVAVIACTSMLGLPAAAGAGSTAGCGRASDILVATSGAIRVVRDPPDGAAPMWWACRTGAPHPRRVQLNSALTVDDFVASITIHRSRVFYVESQYDEDSLAGPFSYVEAMDVDTGSFTTFGSPYAGHRGAATLGHGGSVSRFAFDATRVVWISCPSAGKVTPDGSGCGPGDMREVFVTRPADGRRLRAVQVARGAQIAPMMLAINAGRMHWTQAGRARSAPLPRR